MTDEPAAIAFICVTCRGVGEDERPGRQLLEALQSNSLDRPHNGVTFRAVECLSVCKRPCTVALTAAGKWTYVVGDLDPEAHVEDVIAMTERYSESLNGIVPWRERPLSFRKGVISRIPPLGFPS
jgi:predicted metal-binding protein